jgi:ATP synthase F subunit
MARAASEEGALVAVIADEDTITGFLLAGVGDVDLRKRTNFLVVDGKTTVRHIEATFKDFTNRDDVAIVLISQPIANMIRNVIANHAKARAAAAGRVGAAAAAAVGRPGSGAGGRRPSGRAPPAAAAPLGLGRRRRVRRRPPRAPRPPRRRRSPPLRPTAPSHSQRQAIPAVLEIPSKDSPYDPNQDSLLLRVRHLLGLGP